VQPLRLDRLTFAGKTTFPFSIINLAMLGPYWMNRQVIPGGLETAASLMAPTVLGV